MHRSHLMWTVAIVAACSKPASRAADESPTMDTSAPVAPAAQAPAPEATLSLSDIAGRWNMRTMDEDGKNPVHAELNATADTSGWTMTATGRKPVPVRVVAVAGDSIVTERGPYESFILKGIQVRTRNVSRLQDGKLVGVTEAHYRLKDGRDSVSRRPSVGTRMP
ncbi:MAG TPA: hypothetical protein VJQ44_09110 [Gemmatimonadales bacterium]|nr:hypothetical protein [Gemmatimonadales bacterium]